MSNPYGNDPYGQQPPSNPYGGSGGSSFDAPGVGGFEQPKTDGVSVASFVLSLLCCTGLIGLILGFVGLSRTKGGQRKGRGFAIAGIVLGILSVLAGIAAILFAVVFAKDVRSVEDLETGQCINADGIKQGESEAVGIITEVDCSEDHDGQVIATKTLSDQEAADYDFGNQEQIATSCGEMLDPELAATLIDPKYFLAALTESKTPDGGDQVACIITLANGDDLTEDLL